MTTSTLFARLLLVYFIVDVLHCLNVTDVIANTTSIPASTSNTNYFTTTTTETQFPSLLCLQGSAQSLYRTFHGVYVLDTTQTLAERPVYKNQRLNGQWYLLFVDELAQWIISDQVSTTTSPQLSQCYAKCAADVQTPDLCSKCWQFYDGFNDTETACDVQLIPTDSDSESDCIGYEAPNDDAATSEQPTQSVATLCFDSHDAYTGEYVLRADTRFDDRAVWQYADYYLYYSARWKYWVIHTALVDAVAPAFELICVRWFELIEPWNCSQWLHRTDHNHNGDHGAMEIVTMTANCRVSDNFVCITGSGIADATYKQTKENTPTWHHETETSLQLISLPTTQITIDVLWINEFSFDTSQQNFFGFVEVAGIAGTRLNHVSIVLYNANGSIVTELPFMDQSVAEQQNGFGAVHIPFLLRTVSEFSTNGIALVDANTNTVIQFISYGGTIHAQQGVAAGLSSINVKKTSNYAAQVCGTGNKFTDFSFTSSTSTSTSTSHLNAGFVNECQTFQPRSADESPTWAFGLFSNVDDLYAFCVIDDVASSSLSPWTCDEWRRADDNTSLSTLDVERCDSDGVAYFPAAFCFTDDAVRAGQYTHAQGIYGVYTLLQQYDDLSVDSDVRPVYVDAGRNWFMLWDAAENAWIITQDMNATATATQFVAICDAARAQNVLMPTQCARAWYIHFADGLVSNASNARVYKSQSQCLSLSEETDKNIPGTYTEQINLCFEDETLSGTYKLVANTTQDERRVWYKDDLSQFVYYDASRRVWLVSPTSDLQLWYAQHQNYTYAWLAPQSPYCLLWNKSEPFNCTRWYTYSASTLSLASQKMYTENCVPPTTSSTEETRRGFYGIYFDSDLHLALYIGGAVLVCCLCLCCVWWCACKPKDGRRGRVRSDFKYSGGSDTTTTASNGRKKSSFKTSSSRDVNQAAAMVQLGAFNDDDEEAQETRGLNASNNKHVRDVSESTVDVRLRLKVDEALEDRRDGGGAETRALKSDTQDRRKKSVTVNLSLNWSKYETDETALVGSADTKRPEYSMDPFDDGEELTRRRSTVGSRKSENPFLSDNASIVLPGSFDAQRNWEMFDE